MHFPRISPNIYTSLAPLSNVNLPLRHGMLARPHRHHPVHDERWDPPTKILLRDGLLPNPPVALVDRPCTPDGDHHPDGAVLVPRLVVPLHRLLHELECVLVYALILRVNQLVTVRHDGD